MKQYFSKMKQFFYLKELDQFVNIFVLVSASDFILLEKFVTETWRNDNCDKHCFKKHGYQKLFAGNRVERKKEMLQRI